MAKTYDGGKSAARKVKAKAMESARKEKEDLLLEENNALGIDRLKFDIGKLQNTIKNCDYDLNGMFPNNKMIINKKLYAEIQLKEKLEELKKLEVIKC